MTRCELPPLDEVISGRWIPGKHPSSVALRRHLAEFVRGLRAQVREQPELMRPEERGWMREAHRRHRHAVMEVETGLDKLRWMRLQAMTAKGGVQ